MMAVTQAVKANLNGCRLHPSEATCKLNRSLCFASEGFMNQVHRVDGLLEVGDLHSHAIPPNVFASPDLGVNA
jgi:hypothetical protein